MQHYEHNDLRHPRKQRRYEDKESLFHSIVRSQYLMNPIF